MKKNLFKLVISLIFVVMTVVCLSAVMLTDASALDPATGFDGGAGTSGNPYQIATPAQWLYFANYINEKTHNGEYFKLTADITFNTGDASTWGSSAPSINLANHNGNDYRVGKKHNEDYPFQGTFDGDGHVISGVYMSISGGTVGLFGATAKGYTATIKNLVVTNSYFNSPGGEVGAIVGQTSGGTTTVESVFVTDSVYINSGGNEAGGIIGHNGGNGYNGITTTYQTVVIRKSVCGAHITTTGNRSGGFLGNGNGGSTIFSDCLSYAQVVATGTEIYNFGGILGNNSNQSASPYATITFDNCMNFYRPDTSGVTDSKTNYVYHIHGGASNSTNARRPIIRNCVAPGGLSRYQGTGSSGNVSVSVSDTSTNEEDRALLLSKIFTDNFLTSDSAGTALNSNSNWSALKTSRTFGGETAAFSDFCFPTSVCQMLGWNFNVLRTSLRSGTSITTSGHTFLNSSTISIGTASQFVRFINYFDGYYNEPCANGALGKTIKLTESITFNSGTTSASMLSSAPSTKLRPIGTEANPFRGTFNGQKYTLSGFYMLQNINPSTGSQAAGYGNGIFGNIGVGATIQNLIIANSCFIDEEWVGAIVGEMHGGTIENIWVKSDVYVKATNGACVGGMVGGAVDTQGNTRIIRNCVFAGTVAATGTAGTGGIFGAGSGGKVLTIDKCLVLGSVNSSGGSANVCGIVGYDNYAATISSSIFAGTGNLEYPIGDFGSAGASVTGCYSIVDSDEDHYQYNANGNKNTGVTYGDTASDYICGPSAPTGWTARGTVTSIAGVNVTNVREVCVPSAMSTLFGAIGSVPTSRFNGTAPAWLVTAHSDGTITINSKARYLEFVKFYNGDYSDVCATGAAGKTVNLDADLTFNTTASSGWASSAPSYNMTAYILGSPTVPFCGIFDGNGKTISGFYASKTTKGDTGVFGEIGGTVRNLIITNSYFYTSQHTIGALAAQVSMGATVQNVYVTKSVYVTAYGAEPNGNVGGLIGSVNDGNGSGTVTISGCLNAATVKSEGNTTASYRCHVGGIIGITQSELITISSCMNAGLVQGSFYVGGIVGEADKQATIQNCLNVGTVIGDTKTNNMYLYADIWCGKVASGTSVTLTNCYGINSRLAEHQSDTSIGTISRTNVTQVSYLSLYGSSASTTISGFTKRANDIMVPSGVASYASSDKFFTIRMENGASVRTKTPFGIRFVADLNPAAFTNITERGILYGPTSKVAASGFNPSSLTLKTDYVKVPSQVYTEGGNGTNGYHQFALAVNVAEKNYYVDFSARAYVIDNGVTYYSDYIELNNSRSVSNVARLACEDVASSSGSGYTNAVGTVYSPYTSAQRTELNKYFSTEVRVLHIEMATYEKYPDGTASDANRTASITKAVREIYKYDPDVICVTGASGITFSNLSGYTTSGVGNSATAAVRVLYSSRFSAGTAGDISTWGRYVYLTDSVTGKSSFFMSVDANLTNSDNSNLIKNDTTIGSGISKGLIVTGYFNAGSDNATVKNEYLSSIRANASTQYFTNYTTRHDVAGTSNLQIKSGSVYKSSYATPKRYRISEDQFGAFSDYHASVCDYILK